MLLSLCPNPSGQDPSKWDLNNVMLKAKVFLSRTLGLDEVVRDLGKKAVQQTLQNVSRMKDRILAQTSILFQAFRIYYFILEGDSFNN